MRLYHYMKAEHVLRTLESGCLKVATIADLNDPFELLAFAFGSGQERAVQRRLKDWLHDRVGLICLSESWTEPVMWSHYGDCHRGVVLAFELSEESVHKVTYSDDRILHRLDFTHNPPSMREQFQPLLYSMMTTKSRAWSYEREFRKFVFDTEWTKKPIPGPRGQAFFFDYRKTMNLVEVILGPDCVMDSTDVRTSLIQGGLTAEVTKARRAFRTFSIVRDRSTPILHS